jgi:hypothetical protein
MSKMQKHFVTFYSPGTFVAESTTNPIAEWDVDAAVKMAGKITERHGASPYGFRFTTRERGDDDLDSKVVATSPMHYIGGLIRTVEEVRAKADLKERILLSNMEGNGYARVWQTTKGWLWTQPLEDDDVVLAEPRP